MNYLLTGASGFLGSILKKVIPAEKIITLGRNQCDISLDLINVDSNLNLPISDVVIHAAGKAHMIPKSKAERDLFFQVNVDGTKNLLKLLEKNSLPSIFIFISSVSVYGLNEANNVNEGSPLLASDPYGMSKIEAEKLVIEWAQKHGIKYYIFRLPLIAGENPPGNLGAMIKGIKKGYYFNINGGVAHKSVVMAKDVVNLILNLSGEVGIYNLTDRCHPNFFELSKLISSQLGKKVPLSIPYFMAFILGKTGDLFKGKFPLDSLKVKKICSNLTFDDLKAVKGLGWKPDSVLESWQLK